MIVGALSLAAVIGCYWYMATRPGVNPALVPSPPKIVASFGEELRSGDLWINTLASLKRVLIGYAIGAAAALILGALAGWFRYWGYVLNPIIDALRPDPGARLHPARHRVGGHRRAVAHHHHRARGIQADRRQRARGHAAGRADLRRRRAHARRVALARVRAPSRCRARFPTSSRACAPACRPASSALVAAELIAAPSGLGFMIQNAGQYFRTDVTIVGIIVIGLLGALLDQIANRAGRALTSWSEVRRDP